ncbi:hypothetical protein B0H13DRAFT_2317186 [Mycena leptocephala]|nr:hypothetical protein B0H13DRAFT_2317186 [Mycena leptocephala]
MDVHRSRAECMLQLGDISMGHNKLLKAGKQVHHINERLANISEDVLEQRRNNLTYLTELNAPAGTMQEPEDDLSDIEDLDKIDMVDGKELGLIAA